CGDHAMPTAITPNFDRPIGFVHHQPQRRKKPSIAKDVVFDFLTLAVDDPSLGDGHRLYWPEHVDLIKRQRTQEFVTNFARQIAALPSPGCHSLSTGSRGRKYGAGA